MALNITGQSISDLPPATGSVDMGNQTVINMSDPVNPTDGANLETVQANRGLNITYSSNITLPSNICWPITGFVTLSGGAMMTIPGSSNLFVMGGTGNLQPPGTYPNAHAYGGLPQTSVLTSQDFLIITNAATNAPGLTFSASAGVTYEVDCMLHIRASISSLGIQVGIAYSGTLVNSSDLYFAVGASNSFVTSQAAIGSALTPTFGLAGAPIKLYSIVRALTSGNITVQFYSNNTNTAILEKNSRMTITTIGANQN